MKTPASSSNTSKHKLLTDRTMPAASSRANRREGGGGGGPKARQGCWTCKRRKIGCDRELPACNNCLRTGRECLGYGIRLVWPDRPDGRRKLQKIPTHRGGGEGGDDASLDPEMRLVSASHLHPHYGEQFLNMTFEDLNLSRQDISAMKLQIRPLYSRPAGGLSFNPDVKEIESHFLSYYEQRIARMVSTVDSKNGFRQELLPMALSAASTATSGLLNAILALSAFHRHGAEAARPYKANALRLLSASLLYEPSSNPAIVDAQLATSMMLCVYNVFDESEGYWHLHLNGARNLIHRAATVQGGRLDYSFLYTWFLYHEVLGAFSQPPRKRLEGSTSLELIQGSGFDNSIIIGSLGCSVEVMEIIHHINALRPLPGEDPRDRSASEIAAETQQAKSLEERLLNLTQSMDPQDFAHHSPKERTKAMTTAELYRVATLLYLRRTSPAVAGSDHRSVYLEQAFQLLGSLDVCTSPWPLFVIACETETDQQRIEILRTLDLMNQSRKIGNVFVLRTIIESFWKQQDLQADSEKPKQIKWWELITFDTAAPWFI